MIKSKSAILKSLGNWDYDEISVNDPNPDQVIVKVIQCGICSTDVVRSMKVGFYNYPIVPGHEIIGKIFMRAFKKMIKNRNKINNEYYVGNSINQLINENYNVIPFEVEQYICLGTLQDLKVYNFWSGYFNDKI